MVWQVSVEAHFLPLPVYSGSLIHGRKHPAKMTENYQQPGKLPKRKQWLTLERGGGVVLITGCSPDGLGPEVARAIRLTGADVFITARDIAKGKQVAQELLSDGKPGKVEVIQIDLGSLGSVRGGAQKFLPKSGNKLNVLINNAGK